MKSQSFQLNQLTQHSQYLSALRTDNSEMHVKPVLLICSCKAYEPFLHAALQRMAHPAWLVVGLLGGGSETAYDPATGILTVTTADTYEALPAKIHAALSWIRREWPEVPGVFKTDEDIYFFSKDELASAINSNLSAPYWGITTDKCKENYVSLLRIAYRFVDKSLRPKHQTAHYCYGGGYWVSASALDVIQTAGDAYNSSCLEDVCTGYVLNQAGIEPVRILVRIKEVPRCKELLELS
jgi:hypothetical protein